MPPVFLFLLMFASTPAEWHSKGMAHVEGGEMEEARMCFAEAVKLDPRSAALRVNLGNVLARLGRRDEAIREFQAALSDQPDHVGALFNLGVLHLETGNPGRAALLLNRARILSPQDDGIVQKYLVALARSRSVVALRNRVGELPDDKCDLSLGIGKELALQGLVAPALDQFRREKKCRPEELSPLLGEASVLLAMNRPKDALEVLEAKGDQARGNVHGRWIMGSASERLGRFTEAFEHFAAAVNLTPHDPRAYMALGLLGLKAKTPQMSDKVFEDAERLFPTAPEFKLGKVLIAQVTGKQSEAEQQCTHLLDSHPDYAPARLLLATLYLDQGRYAKARTCPALRCGPRWPLWNWRSTANPDSLMAISYSRDTIAKSLPRLRTSTFDWRCRRSRRPGRLNSCLRILIGRKARQRSSKMLFNSPSCCANSNGIVRNCSGNCSTVNSRRHKQI
jgi:tetratricopeptide (TPR) repeat protein